MMRREDRERERAGDEDADGLNIISADDEDDEEPEDEEEVRDLFSVGMPCYVCGEEGQIGLDPTCRGAYDGEAALYCFRCAADGLREAFAGIDGISVVVEPFGKYDAQYSYRIDEMPAYQFVREDIEAVSWLLLTIGDACARCGEQSHHAWLTRSFVDAKLPEGRAVFRNLDRDVEHLCNGCVAAALVKASAALKLPMMTLEVPRSAMGVLMPTAG